MRGKKSEREKFASGGRYTIEAMMGNGWSAQSATSHFLGRTSAAFDIKFLNQSNELDYATGRRAGA